jgi:hypothetical protein
MWWKVSQFEFEHCKSADNRRDSKLFVDGGSEPGLIVCRDGEPIGCCAVEPRDRCARLARSRPLAPIDDKRVLSAACFFVRAGQRPEPYAAERSQAFRRHTRRPAVREISERPEWGTTAVIRQAGSPLHGTRRRA